MRNRTHRVAADIEAAVSPELEPAPDRPTEIMVVIDGAHNRAAHGCQSRHIDVTIAKVEVAKIKWADFQISTRSRSMEMTIRTREKLHQIALDLIRSVFPPPKGVRLVGVTLSNFRSQTGSEAAELPFREM